MSDLAGLTALIESEPWAREGWGALVDNYREHQAELADRCGRPDRTGRGYRAAVEVLARQASAYFNEAPDAVGMVIRGRLYAECGLPDRPKGLDEWRAA